jgi:uncharacterized zinc-type alcohol dehydrogenase-like protein
MTATNGKVIIIGLPANDPEYAIHAFDLIPKRKSIVGSMIGGIKETQDMLNFCSEKEIFCDVEVIKPDYISEAYERVLKGDVRYRFSIDCTQM